jgi:hypothetical protein
MYKLKLICVVVLLTVGVISCNSSSNCNGEILCQQKNTKILNAVMELNNIGQKVHCTKDRPEIIEQVETVINKIESSEELATLAAIARSLQVYESNQIPTCRNSRSDNVFDQAYWICIKKLSKSSESKSKEYLQKIKESSFLITSEERQLFDEILEK